MKPGNEQVKQPNTNKANQDFVFAYNVTTSNIKCKDVQYLDKRYNNHIHDMKELFS